MTAVLYLNTGEPDAATSCTSGSEGGGWKSAHRVTRRPPTLLDGIWFLDLPGRQQKDAIWGIYLDLFELDRGQPRPRDDSWTGAEIRACCRLAALLDLPLTAAAQNVVPVAVTASESVERLRGWASGRCLDAEAAGVYHRSGNGATKPARKVRRSDPSNN